MNNRGIAFLFYLMMGMTLIVLGIALAPASKQIFDQYMSDASCSAPSSDMVQGLCWIMDSYKILVVGTFIFIGIGYLFIRRFV